MKLYTSLWAAISLLFSAFVACDDTDDCSTSPSHLLQFSQDTLFMDTLFTKVPTATRKLMVYNRNPKALRVASISLAGEGKTGFRINVDGIQGNRFDQVEIAAGDSMYIFVEATLPKQHQAGIVLAKDSIRFDVNGTTQEVKLRAYAQDAQVWRGKVIDRDMTVSSQQPILIYDSLYIDTDAHLTLEAGAQLYVHGTAGLHVRGQLTVNGEQGNPVVFRGDRTDKLFPYLPYDRLPGQWGGIHIYKESYGNSIRHADIHGGEFGIRCDSSDTSREKLRLEHSAIRQVSGNALELRHCLATIGNCEFSNAGGHCVSLQGGHYDFTHCTLANYFSWSTRRGVALHLTNDGGTHALPLTAATFRNCLIAGSGEDELKGERRDDGTAFEYLFSHCLINSTAETSERFPDTIWTKDDNFLLLDEDTQQYDFRLNASSAAINIGNKDDAQAYPTDRNGMPRLADEAPDAGCYEYHE